MKAIITLIAWTLSLVAISATADNHAVVKERRVMIETSGDAGAQIDDIMKQVEQAVGDDEQANVMVVVDDNGEVSITKLAPGEALPNIDMEHMDGKNIEHEVIVKKIMGTDAPHAPHAPRHHRARIAMPHMDKLNPAAASCILKNIAKANSDKAANLVRQACVALNQEE